MAPTPTSDDIRWLHLALDRACAAYPGHLDRYGRPKLLHVVRVSQQLTHLSDQIAALLHDLPEDFPDAHGLPQLAAAGFPAHILAVVDCLTRRDGKQEPWEEYLARIVRNPAAVRVKLADLTDNLDLSRNPELTPEDLPRYQRYLQARARLLAVQEAQS